jgi:tRNA-dihydrouridine synthase 1
VLSLFKYLKNLRVATVFGASKMTLSPLSTAAGTVPAAGAAAPAPTAETAAASEKINYIGRELFEKIGKPRTVLAPMVDQSELAWRIISRKYGADLCYTPMYHARLFATSESYRNDMFSELDGDEKVDRPLVVQFCANKPDELLAAARLVEGRCDAIDLNLGCPQGIAKRGKYGAFLMDDWDLIWNLINVLHKNLNTPVTAKIRVYEDREKTLAYAKHVLSAGAQFLTVHGRTREMKGQKTGLADWSIIKYLRDNLPPETVMIANGNLLYQEDIPRSLEATKTDAVMSAEGNLYNPAIFNLGKNKLDDRFPRVDKLLREYFEIAKTTPGNASKTAMKSHFFKILHAFLPIHTDVRAELGSIRKGSYDEFEQVVQRVEQVVAEIYASGKHEDVLIEDSHIEEWGGSYKEVPYWRCQPYFRTVDGVKANGKRSLEDRSEKQKEKKAKKEEETTEEEQKTEYVETKLESPQA